MAGYQKLESSGRIHPAQRDWIESDECRTGGYITLLHGVKPDVLNILISVGMVEY